MYNCVRDMSFLFFYPSINVITSELPLFMRECKARIYSPESYFISKSLAEVPQYILLPLIYSTILYWMTGHFSVYGSIITTEVEFLQMWSAWLIVIYTITCLLVIGILAIGVWFVRVDIQRSKMISEKYVDTRKATVV
ncbi:hypothetical protein GCK32_017090 [Trichostrongylus colubriformis]|uniref:ABC-2 type transporter transmembrane domain-containing protein n=1 Tax=Trichostrongylus colubriformis TaxID=6319 RepID=A0AAN8G944_TRICO